MTALLERRRADARGGALTDASSLPLGDIPVVPVALACARDVHATVDRRSPEAGALAGWLAQHAAGLGVPDALLPPDDDAFDYPRRRGVGAGDWRRLGAVLDAAATATPPGAAGAWVAALSGRLALDALEARLLSLALHYRTEQRVERLHDALSECRGGPDRLRPDATLLALLLRAPVPAVAARLTGGGRLQGSGLLQVTPRGDLVVAERLVSLLRREVAPAADLYDQLLGTMGASPLPWESFAHLGREVALAEAVLRAALAGAECGINVLLYGPPGTGKTSFAATLAARVGVRLRPVAEADEDGGEPSRAERPSGLRLAQRLAAPGDTVLLFDEAEDLFVAHGRQDEGVARACSCIGCWSARRCR